MQNSIKLDKKVCVSVRKQWLFQELFHEQLQDHCLTANNISYRGILAHSSLLIEQLLLLTC